MTYAVFTLRIELGNDAMQTGDDVAAALRTVAERVEGAGIAEGKIRDDNGNTVGEYACTETL